MSSSSLCPDEARPSDSHNLLRLNPIRPGHSVPGSFESNRQTCRTVHMQAFPWFPRLIGGRLKTVEPGEHLRKRDSGLEARSFQRLKCARSVSGIPNISPITIIGSGIEKSSARSISLRAMFSSSKWRQSSRMRGSRLVIDPGVNAFETNARNLECLGGSRKIIHSTGPCRELKSSCSLSTRLTPS